MMNVLADRRLTQRGGGGDTHRPQMSPYARPGVGNGGVQRVVQGSTSPAPLPLDSTPTQSVVLNTDTIFAP